jgi:endonuclease-3
LAFRNLKAKFPNYGKLYSARLKEIEEVLRRAGLYRQKAKRIKEILKIIKEREGQISLKRLKELNPQDAYDYLISLPGVGEKTASCVLLFSLNKSALPVDTHIFRVSKRLGILEEGADFKSAHRILAEKVPKKEYLNFHIKMIMHGRKICKAQNPRCGICFLNHLCDYAKRT